MVRLVVLLCLAAMAHAAPAPLAIVSAAIEQTEGGTPLPASFEHIPGELLFFSFQIDGYQVSPDQKIRLRTKTDVFDPKGVKVVTTIEKPVEAELSPQDKEWKPKVRHEIQLPSLAPSGTYKIVVEATDELGKKSTVKELPFIVQGRKVEPSDTLVIRNYGFYRSDEATEPLTKAAYRPGDSVWARFDITGYKFGPGNRIDVSYGIAVLNAEGKQLWAQPEAAVERSESFYPKPFVPGSMSLNLQPNIRPGEYAIVVSVKDGIGGQTCETKQAFFIE